MVVGQCIRVATDDNQSMDFGVPHFQICFRYPLAMKQIQLNIPEKIMFLLKPEEIYMVFSSQPTPPLVLLYLPVLAVQLAAGS